MQFSLVYLVHRFFYRLGDFFHHWYVHGSRNLFHWLISFLENIDRTVALRVTLKHFFEPLYKDYTVVGRIMGIVFRPLRILLGVFVYLIIIALFAPIYVFWLLVPPAIFYYAAQHL